MKLSAEGYLINDLGKEMMCGNHCQLCGVHCAMFDMFRSDTWPATEGAATLMCTGRAIYKLDVSEFMQARDKV